MPLSRTLEVCLGTKRTTASSSCSLHLCLLWSISICLFLSFCTPPFRSWLYPTIFLGLHSLLFPFYSHVHCPAPLPFFFLSSPPPYSSLSPSPPPVCDESFSWRCCSIASVCPACCANPPPHQALGPSTHTKYFYLFIQFHGLPGGNLRLDRS